ncbi:phosphatase PAP2 family protein [Nocardia jejuensis]|uniref:phosphatase PAP2 family protein n=1 Tax=Nocardia jejuensis TaxID=328049 RepID=UPI00082E14CF|nr:phosphatase PAP2 family protein [Nocardia jejuensis]
MLSTPQSPVQQDRTPPTTRRPRLPDLPVSGVLSTLVLAAAALILTCNVVWIDGPIGPDTAWLQTIVDHRTSTMTTLAKAVSDIGDTQSMTAVAVIACLLLAWWRRWEQLLLVAITSMGAAVLVLGGKRLVGRDRPPVVDHLVTESSYSYPSGHTLGVTVVLGILLALAVPPLRTLARVAVLTIGIGFILAVSLSRSYLGVHWPSDLLGGWLIGGCWLALCLTLRPYLRPLADRLNAADPEP